MTGRETLKQRFNNLRPKMQRGLKAGLAALAFASMGEGAIAGMWQNSQQDSGRYVLNLARPRSNPAMVDGFRVINWNTESEDTDPTDDLRTLRRYRPDFVMGQEVVGPEAAKMRHLYQGYSQVFGIGKRTLNGKAFGNVLLSREIPKNIHSRSIDGTSLMQTEFRTGVGFLKDAGGMLANAVIQVGQHDPSEMLAPTASLNMSFDNTKNGLQESRNIVEASFTAKDGLYNIPVIMATTHITGEADLKGRQLGSVLHFMADYVKLGQITVICGDFNTTPERPIAQAMAKDGFITPRKAGIYSYINGDYCSYAAPGVPVQSVTVTALDLPGSREHRPLLFDMRLWPLPGLAAS